MSLTKVHEIYALECQSLWLFIIFEIHYITGYDHMTVGKLLLTRDVVRHVSTGGYIRR